MKTHWSTSLLSLLLALSMILSCGLLLVACGSESDETKDTSDMADTSDTSDTSETPDTSESSDIGEDDPGQQEVATYFDKTKFHIGTYTMGPKTEENLLDMKKAGIDFVIDSGFSTEMLDLFQKNKMGVFLGGVLPGWWGDNGQNGGNLRNTYSLETYASYAEAIPDHPAIWGVDIGDEPSALDFPYYGQAVATVQAKVPQYEVYLNLYPNYASTNVSSQESYSQLGTDNFKDYIAAYVANVDTDYICYDHYPFGNNHRTSDTGLTMWYDNLEIVADACRESGRSLWIVVQCNNDDPGGYLLQEYKMEYQAYCAMAYGAEVVTWACWYPGWYSHNVLNADGTKTEQYDKVKKANKQIKGIADTYMEYKNIATHYVGFAEGSAAYNELFATVDNRPEVPECKHVTVASFSNDVFKDVTSPDGGSFLVGEMVSRKDDGKVALMIADATNLASTGYEQTITFKVEGNRAVTLHQGTKSTVLTPGASGVYSVKMTMGSGFLITAE